MDISIGCYVSCLGTIDKDREIEELESQMKHFFQNKVYSPDVMIYSIGIICVKPEYDQFSKPKRPRYYRNRDFKTPRGFPDDGTVLSFVKYMYIDLKIDFSPFAYSNKIEGYTIIGNTLLKYLKEMKYPVAIRKSFDKERFNKDMKEFFQSIGCKLDVE